ncbi:hypothetical protein M404DRAFT_308947 [Pisolithus tinctorius Marx 270]|uniref:Uncharacterized protein n=1 Tax=Pisolithus tinctorius Marx 270 TaxID=870435 RepID=A0A0C3PKN5_PISTI|nr:hypothetical protein M404DRAFT_308947 [Pisolithus tinctorius Marx 270]
MQMVNRIRLRTLLVNTTANPFADLYSITAPPIESTPNPPPTGNGRASPTISHCDTRNVSCRGGGAPSRHFYAIVCLFLGFVPSERTRRGCLFLSWCSRPTNCIASRTPSVHIFPPFHYVCYFVFMCCFLFPYCAYLYFNYIFTHAQAGRAR